MPCLPKLNLKISLIKILQRYNTYHMDISKINVKIKFVIHLAALIIIFKTSWNYLNNENIVVWEDNTISIPYLINHHILLIRSLYICAATSIAFLLGVLCIHIKGLREGYSDSVSLAIMCTLLPIVISIGTLGILSKPISILQLIVYLIIFLPISYFCTKLAYGFYSNLISSIFK